LPKSTLRVPDGAFDILSLCHRCPLAVVVKLRLKSRRVADSLSTLDRARLDTVIQYALSLARQELAATHLVKYAYLGDLAFARTHQGETFTGARWVFLHYGPYSREVHDRVPEAAKVIGAEARGRHGPDGTEFTRYKGGDETLAERLRDQLPAEVASAVRWGVQEHGGDMPSLLEDVYRTEPMLRAAPGETFDFAPPKGGTVSDESSEAPVTAAEKPKAPWKVRMEERERKAQILAEVQRRLRARAERKRPGTGPSPRYDDLFAEGVRVMDTHAGDPVPLGPGEAIFSDSVWRSTSRRNADDPSD
jgi:hypothetical protein